MKRFLFVLSLLALLAVALGAGWPAGATASASSAPKDAPTVSSVAPVQAYSYQTTTITVTGSGFVMTPTVNLGINALWDVTVVSSDTLTTQIPANTAPGVYELVVTNPDGSSAALNLAFTVLADSDDSVGAWQAGPSLNTPRSYNAVIAVGDYIYAIGDGPYSSASLSVEFAHIQVDGSLQPWQFTAPLVEHASAQAAYANGYIYVIGQHVQRAQVNADGSLAAWQLLDGPTDYYYGLPMVGAGSLFSVLANGPYDREHDLDEFGVWSSALSSGGAPGDWSLVDHYWGVDTGPVVSAGSFFYRIGGRNNHIDSHVVGDVVGWRMNADGSVSTLGTVGHLGGSDGLEQEGVAAADGYLYAVGGRGDEQFHTTQVRRAPINNLSDWQHLPSLAIGRTNPGAVVTHGFLYVVGGAGAAVAQLPIGSLRPLALSQSNFQQVGGTLTISGTNFLPVPSVSLGDTALAVTFVSTRTLTVTIPPSLPTARYSLTITNPDGRGAIMTNTVTIDNEPPTGSISINGAAPYAQSSTVTLTLAASDDLSGVASMAFSDDGTNFSADEPLAASKTWALPAGDGPKTVYVRFTDAAGNVSAPVSDTIILDTTPPSGSVLINGGEEYSDSFYVTLTLSATDQLTGLACIRIFDPLYNSGCIPFATTFTQVELGNREGQYNSLSVAFRDRAGNESVVRAGVFVDTIAPTASIAALDRYRSDPNFTVRWSGADSESGIKNYDVQYWDNASGWLDWRSGVTAVAAVFNGVEDHTYNFRVRSRDNADNVSDYSPFVTTTVDSLPPTLGTPIINGGALSTAAPGVLLNIAAHDTGSGVRYVSFANDTPDNWSDWFGYGNPISWSLAPTDGLRTVYVRVRDAAGYISTAVSSTIQLDRSVGINYSVSINDGAQYTNQLSVTLSLGAMPYTAQMLISNDGGFAGAQWEPYAAHKTWSLTPVGTALVSRVVYLRFRQNPDSLGSSTVQDDIVLDFNAPEGSVSIDGTANAAAAAATVQLHLHATDDLSGVAGMQISNRADFAGATWRSYATSLSWNLGSNNAVFVRFRDQAGNISATAFADEYNFSDVASADYFYTPVHYLASVGAISGYADGSFRPYANTTRGQLAKIVVLAEAFPIRLPARPSFRDVPANNVFYSFIETAVARGIISGYDVSGGREYRPNNNVTRGQLSKIIVKAAGWPLLNPTRATFQDVPRTNPFYQEIETAVNHGIISGYSITGGKEFRWGNNATRGQISKILYLAVTANP